jgi:hypothetical protein
VPRNGYFFTWFVCMKLWDGADEVSAIVLDLGSHSCKAGYAGEDQPKCVFPSVRYLSLALSSLDSASGCQNVLILKIAEAQNNLGAEYHMSPMVGASCVSLCLQSRYLSFASNCKCISSWSIMYSPYPMHKCYHTNREGYTDLLNQWGNFVTEYCIYLPSVAYYYYPDSAKDMKRISTKV